ncbi:dihydrolipoyl dehydrogenase [Alkaliphilus crotonatoxidans]
MKDLVIIGGGPGGTAAAEKAVRLGWKVALIERDQLGGTCLNRGCIPTKVLFRKAEIIDTLNHISEYGIELKGFEIKLEAMRKRKEEIVLKLREGLEKQMNLLKVEVIKGEGKIIGPNEVQVIANTGEVTTIETRYILIATGSEVIIPPIPGVDLPGVVTSDDLMDLSRDIEELVIVGGGVIGLEWAVIYNALGAKVKVVELQEDILMFADKDIRKRLSAYLKKKGIDLFTKHKITAIEEQESRLVVYCETSKGTKQLEADTVLMAIGRRASWKGLDLDSLGIEYDTRGIKIDRGMRTNIESIYAIGDVTGECLLAHTAHHQGIIAVDNMAGANRKINYDHIPSCVFVLPEYAKVGLTEEEAAKRGISYRVGKAAFLGNGKALALGETDGYVKIICDEEETIIGVQILGPHASDLIHEGLLAVSKGLKIIDITESIHAHPTLAETLYEAASRIE